MFGQNQEVNLQKLYLTFEALGENSSFHHMQSLKTLYISQDTDSPIVISAEGFQGLTNLTCLTIKIKSFDALENQLMRGLLSSLPNLEFFYFQQTGID